nr:DUF1589 domain-containing protein [Rhodopirellula sp. UBA1907]
MLWNKARRVRDGTCQRHGKNPGQRPSPGTTWPTLEQRRRPCSTWHPRRCFGTKRVVQALPQDPKTTVKPPRQAQPGLRTPPS